MTVGPLVDVVFPQDQPDTTQGRIARWLKAPGETIAEHEPLLEIETEKVTLEVPSPATGTLQEILIAEGADAEVGQVVATHTLRNMANVPR